MDILILLIIALVALYYFSKLIVYLLVSVLNLIFRVDTNDKKGKE